MPGKAETPGSPCGEGSTGASTYLRPDEGLFLLERGYASHCRITIGRSGGIRRQGTRRGRLRPNLGKNDEVVQRVDERKSAHLLRRYLGTANVALRKRPGEASVCRSLGSHEHMFADQIRYPSGLKKSRTGYLDSRTGLEHT